MPKARILQAADAVVEELKANAATWSQELEVEDFDPERDFVPEFLLNDTENCELPGLEKLRVVVIGRRRIRDGLTRGEDQRDYSIEIGFLKRLGKRPKEETEELILLVEEVEDFFSDAHEVTGTEMRVVDAATDPIFDPAELRRNVFASLLVLTLREWL